MYIDNKDKIYLIETKIKALNGKKELLLKGEPVDGDTQAIIEHKIQALTNMLEML